MSLQKSREFWSTQDYSGHRSDSDEFYKEKAEEHAGVMLREHRLLESIDIGCGTGELTLYLSDYINIKVGLDYSDSMLNVARKNLSSKSIILINDDIFSLLERTDIEIWIACASINQYIDGQGQRKILDIFNNNDRARSIYFYDCVDPIRYSLLGCGISYIDTENHDKVFKMKKIVNRYAAKCIFAIDLMLGWSNRPCQKIGGVEIGYGFLPKFWLSECAKRGLLVKIVSSRLYEYRYHVIINKNVDRFKVNAA